MGTNETESPKLRRLRQVLIGLREVADVVLDAAVVAVELDVGTVHLDLALLAETNVLLTGQRGETPVLRDDDLLTARELVHGAAQGLDGGRAVHVTGSDGQQNLANVHTSNLAGGLAEGATHTGLETIGTGARQHLVDPDDVERVGADAEVETFLTGDLHEVPTIAVRPIM